MTDDHPCPTVLIQVGDSPSSKRRSIGVARSVIAELAQIHATGGDVTQYLRRIGTLEPYEHVLQWGPLRDGSHVNVAQPAPGAFALADDAQPTTLQALERRVAELEAQPDRYRVAKRLRWLAKHDVPAERPSLKCSLYALANELDGGLPGPREGASK